MPQLVVDNNYLPKTFKLTKDKQRLYMKNKI